MSKKYVVSIAYQSDRTFAECLEDNLSSANFAHNQSRSKVVSALAAFITLLSGLWYENKKAAELDSNVEVYATMHDLYIALACGQYAVPPVRWQRFVMGVAQAIGFVDLPDTADSQLAFEKLCEKFESGNSYLTAEMRAYREQIACERLGIKSEDTDTDTPETATAASA